MSHKCNPVQARQPMLDALGWSYMAVAVIETSQIEPEQEWRARTPLENGDHLAAREFLLRYEAMPEVKKAELIGGIVYMSSPVRVRQHGVPDALIQTWLGCYSIATPGVIHATNSTICLSTDDVLQPDGMLLLAPECGGKTRLDEKGYLRGAPELVVEVAASSASVDAREKLASYRRAGVAEYVLWRTDDAALDWWISESDDYVKLQPGNDGILRSKVFPGLCLDQAALLQGDGAKVMARLQEGLQSEAHHAFRTNLGKRQLH